MNTDGKVWGIFENYLGQNNKMNHNRGCSIIGVPLPPSNIETIPNDTDAMQALITGLNSTSKKALIIDEIYVNAMLTMFLNDYNRKIMRPTYFLLRPFDEMKSFTDSEGMFSNQ